MWLQKGNMRNVCYDVNVLYLDCINFNILVVIPYYSFARCNHWRNLNKEYMRSPYAIFTTIM